MTVRGFKRLIGVIGLGLATFIVLALSVHIVEEGHVGVVKHWGKASYQINPGMNFIVPFMATVETIEVRQRKNVEDLTAATHDQLPVTATVSINWTVDKPAAMDLFIQYGGLSQFETRILDPKLRNAAKAAISKYRADSLIRDRNTVVSTIMGNMVELLEGFPVVINSPQIENFTLPRTYMEAVQAKETARQNAEREQHRLDQQRLVAQQAVNSAEANAEAKRIEADAEAYRVLTVATADADAIRMVTAELNKSANYIDYYRVQQWDGILPRTMLSDDTSALVSIEGQP